MGFGRIKLFIGFVQYSSFTTFELPNLEYFIGTLCKSMGCSVNKLANDILLMRKDISRSVIFSCYENLTLPTCSMILYFSNFRDGPVDWTY